jgi:hypothetical protein
MSLGLWIHRKTSKFILSTSQSEHKLHNNAVLFRGDYSGVKI